MSAQGPACAVREPSAAPPPVRSLLRHVQLENLAAGLSGGVVSTLVLHPLDLVKIRFAVSDGLELRPKYNGILHCMTTVWKHEGLQGLYQGVTPNMLGAGASWGLYFFFYNAIKAYKKEGKLESLSATEHLVSAAEAGAMTLCITNPIWVTKTRLVLQYNAGVDPSKRQYRGMFDALIKIYKMEGIRGLYKVLQRDRSINNFHIKDGIIFHREGIKMHREIMAYFQCLSAQVVRAAHSDTTGLWHTENPNEDNTKQVTRRICCILLKHIAEVALA